MRRELLIVSPYFIPGKRGTAFLADLAKRGVQVRVVTNSLSATDVPVVHAGYAKYRKALLRAGVELFEFKSDAERPSGQCGKLCNSSMLALVEPNDYAGAIIIIDW